MHVDAQVLRRPFDNIIMIGENKARFTFSHIQILISV